MNATVSWHEEPNFRGTYSILASCLSTLFVSTWSALHLDIRASDQSGFMRFLDKVGWLVLGLLAPEYLLLLAFNQYMAARALTRFAQHILKTPPEPPSIFVGCRHWIVDGFRHHILKRKVSKNPIVRCMLLLTWVFVGRQAGRLRSQRRGRRCYT